MPLLEMYQGDTRRHKAHPRGGLKKQAQKEVQEICAQDEMKNLRATINGKDQVILHLMKKLNLEMNLRFKSESNEKVLNSKIDHLKDEVECLCEELGAQANQHRDDNKASELRFWALYESNKKEKLATIQETEKAILNLTEKLNLETKLRSESESNVEVLHSQMNDLKYQVESLSKDLNGQIQLRSESESNVEVLHSQMNDLEHQVESLSKDLHGQIQLRSESESNVEVLHSQMNDLEHQVESLSKDLHGQIQLGRDSDESWQLRFSALEKESNNKEKASESSLKVLLTECQDMKNKIQSLSEDLKAQTKLVSDSDKAWMDKMSSVKRAHALKEKTILEAAHTEREALLQKLKEQSRKMHSLQVTCQFPGQQNNHEEELRTLRRQIVNLEDICLRQKKKNLGFFGRRMDVREIELERLKCKVPAREPVDPPPPVHCPPPVHRPSPVYCPPPVHRPSPVYCPTPVHRPSLIDHAPPVHRLSPVEHPPPIYRYNFPTPRSNRRFAKRLSI